ncbi:MAG: hypothetical protein GY953_32135, partial [bacterium]|nr:hypothetical protein [bacterium]
FRDGTRECVRMTVEPARGIQQIWISEVGIDWTPLGEGRTFEPIDGLHDSTGPVYIGTDRPAGTNSFSGKLYYVEVRDGLDGPIVADLDFRTPLQQDGGPERWIDSHGNQFTANGTGWEYVPPEG